jgi:hypothetical protein
MKVPISLKRLFQGYWGGGGCSFRETAGTPALLTSSLFLQANDAIVLQLDHGGFLAIPFKFIIHQSSYHPS